MEYITSRQLAVIAGVSEQAIQKVCKRAVECDTYCWRGSHLEIRMIYGRGGKSGISYQIRTSSLPEELSRNLGSLVPEGSQSFLSSGTDHRNIEVAWWLFHLKPILETKKGSNGRRKAIEEFASREYLDWRGRPFRVSRSVLYSRIRRYEDHQTIHALSRTKRADAGRARFEISRAWDNAVPFGDDTKRQIRADLKIYVKSLLKGGSQHKQTLILASEKLRDITAAYGFAANDPDEAAKVFKIQPKFVTDEHHYKAVHRHKTDRKASEDNKPRIRRTTAGLMPMEVVVMDVHHVNVLVAREDGTTATPKLLAFHDIATGRVFWELVFFEKSGGVRNSDLISATVNMFQNPAFGVPQFLYADNGSEYRFADYLSDALKLGTKVISYQGREDLSRIIRAKPYNAAAKHVEGWFRQMNQQYIQHIPGWIGDDRMNPKRPAMGKLPAPFEAGPNALHSVLAGHYSAYEHMPQSGGLQGKSPAQVFQHHVNKGWTATVMNPEHLLTVFTKPESRTVRRHGIEVKGLTWTCDGLLRYFGNKVLVHIPQYHGFGELLVTDLNGNEIGVAVADEEYHVLDPRGAKESARRNSIRNKALRDLDKSVPDTNVGEELIGFGQKHAPVIPNEPDAVISVNRPVSEKRAILPVSPVNKAREQEESDRQLVNEARADLVAAIKADRKAS